jgi:hypothetical protein
VDTVQVRVQVHVVLPSMMPMLHQHRMLDLKFHKTIILNKLKQTATLN